jgi:CheY-like chemotaxis protein/HPt (histidine-containing phosphotransfer) domain-containing protein
VVSSEQRATWSDLRILLVEDDLTTRDVVLLMLHRLNYRPDMAGDGVEALAAVHASPYDLLLMDVQMPEMDGIEATRRIRWELDARHQPVIFAMSANSRLEDRIGYLQAGMDYFVPKPVRFDALTAALERRNLRHEPSSEEVADGPRIYDPAPLDALMDDLGGDGAEMRQELFETFISDSSTVLNILGAGGGDTSAETLKFVAHKLKSASATLGLLALTSVASGVEDALLSAPQSVDVGFETARLGTELCRATSALHLLIGAGSEP